MEVFGPPWIGYQQKIEKNWIENVDAEDLVLIAGDISWAIHLEDAKIDLDWIHRLPGKKVLLRGNHDYWWNSLKKVEGILPPSIHLIQNNAYVWRDYVIGGSRLWDTPEYGFRDIIHFVDRPGSISQLEEGKESLKEQERIFQRELGRLELSLKEMSKFPGHRLVMTHYPPIGTDLQASRASLLLEKYHVQTCVFGHLHNVKPHLDIFGIKNGVHYYLTAADYLDFTPLKIAL